MFDQLMSKLDAKDAEFQRLLMSKDEEIAILQAGMDQSLLALDKSRQNQHSASGDLQKMLENLKADHLSKLAQILDTILLGCITKIDESLYELESPMHLGNQTANPEYTLQMVENTNNASTDFAISYTKYIEGKGDQTEVINAATNFAQVIGQLLHNTKGVSRLAADDDMVDGLISNARLTAESAQQFLQKMHSQNISLSDNKRGVVAQSNRELTEQLAKLTVLIETLIPKAAEQVATMQGDIADMVENEMLNAARMIEEAALRLAEMQQQQMPQVHSSILDSALGITNAIAHLVKCATVAQQEIVAQGRGRSTKQEFYKKNNRWTEGLISAAKAVAMATNLLVETADGVIKGTHSFEQLIVACNEVASATAQLVAASRVKAAASSRTQDRLEDAAKAVNQVARALVKAVKTIAAKEAEGALHIGEMTPIEFKRKEMEKQVEILRLEKDLSIARKVLGELRRLGYHDDEGAI